MLKRIGIVSALAWMMLAGQALATPIALNPTADVYMRTFGGDFVDTTSDRLNFSQSGGSVTNGVLEFDVSVIPDTATVNSASLEVTQVDFTSNTGSTANVHIYGYVGDGTLDIRDFAATGTLVYTGTIGAGGGGVGRTGGTVLNFNLTDLTPIVNSLASNKLTLRLESDNFAIVRFASLENQTYHPAELTIDYTASTVPVPGALAFAATSIAVLGLVARRQQH